MSNIPPFARALLERQSQNSSSFLMKSPMRNSVRSSQQIRPQKRKYSEDFAFEEEEEEIKPKHQHRKKTDVRRKHFADEEMNENDYKQIINDLKRKNRALKMKVSLLQKEIITLQTKEDDSDQYDVSENEELRAQLKDERVKNRLAQENIRMLENNLRTKDRIIETKDLMIKRLQISCQEQANEYTKISDQLKVNVTNIGSNSRGMSFNDSAFIDTSRNAFGNDGFNDFPPRRNEPPFDDFPPRRNDQPPFDDFTPRRNEQPFDDFPPRRNDQPPFDDFPPRRNEQPPFDDFPPRRNEQPFDDFPPRRNDQPPFDDFPPRRNDQQPPFDDFPPRRNDQQPFDEMPIRRNDEPFPRFEQSPPQKKENVPEAFRGGNYSEDMPIGGAAKGGFNAFQQNDFQSPPRGGFNSFNDFPEQEPPSNRDESIEDIRKKIDKLMPRKTELERKLNLAHISQEEKDRYDQELQQLKKQISSYKIQIKRMGK